MTKVAPTKPKSTHAAAPVCTSPLATAYTAQQLIGISNNEIATESKPPVTLP